MKEKRVKRIWVFSELYYPEQAATGYFLTRIAEDLAAEFDVRVLCAQPTYLARGTKAAKEEVRRGVAISRCAGTTFDKDVLPFRFINLVTISLSILFRGLWSVNRGEYVLAVTNPPTMPFVAAIVCWFRGAQLILKIEDLYPDAVVAAGMIAPGSGWARLFDRLQRFLCDFAARIIVLGRDTEAIIARRYPIDRRKIVYVPHWAEVKEIIPEERPGNPVLARLGLDGKFVVQYSGNIGRTHDVESVLECADILKGEGRIHFLIIGWGAKRDWLTATKAMKGLSNVTILPPLPRNELPMSLNGLDVAIIPLIPGMLGVSVPSRLYNILAAGKPLVVTADDESELARVVREEEVGWVVPPRRPDLLAQAVREAAAYPEKLAAMGRRARRAAESKYASSAGYVALFRQLAGEER
jgi:colanic acid biosynthesis glycosyl transferase WcaI